MSTLYVPVHLDALALERSRQVVGPTADFEILPWFDGQRDRFPGTANVASSIQAEPFADHSMLLEPGVHLHWTLPPGLVRGTTDPDETSGVLVGGIRFPPAPNRWLVVREGSNGARAWIVESDYVHPPGRRPHRAVAYPLNDDVDRSDRLVRGRRYVHLGRQVPIGRGWDPDPDDVHLPDIDAPLTALGYLEPTFAALYANCHSIFGAHDPDVLTGSVTYRVLGWYGGGVADPLADFRLEVDGWSTGAKIARLNAERVRLHELESNEPRGHVELLGDAVSLTDLERLAVLRLAIADRFGWELESPDDPRVPEGVVCYGSTTVDIAAESVIVDSRTSIHEPVGIGNTATEALAALIAGERHMPLLEEQLEAVHVGVAPDHHALDLQAKFRERRHSLQFVESGRRRLWTVRSSHRQHRNADSTEGASDRQPELPADLVESLQLLNEAQHDFDLAAEAVDAARQQTYADWHRAMTLAYSERDVGGGIDAPAFDLDGLYELIDEHDLAPLEAAIGRLGTLRLDRLGSGWTAEHGGDTPTRASRLAEQILAVSTRLGEWDATHDLELAMLPGPRFWRPRDPVVCLHPTLTASKRYAAAGVLLPTGERLPVRLGADPIGHALDPVMAIDALVDAVPELSDVTAGPTQGTVTWNPLLLEWEVEVEVIAAAGNQRAAGAPYDPDFVRIHYHLPDSRPDLIERGDPELAPTTEYLSGRTILHPGTAELLADEVNETVQRLIAAGIDVPDGLRIASDQLRSGEYADVLTQSLGGFHDGLQMLGLERQLGVDDPIGFADQRSRAQRVREALNGLVPSTPRPDAPFHPIRSGEMAIQRLRIVDTFGQTVEWRPSALRAAQPYRHETIAPARVARPDRCALPVRISQGACLDLRWLAADDAHGESTHHRATSPLCGWFLADHLDGALFVYDADGVLLGSIRAEGNWRPAPGADAPVLHPADIGNPHLAERVAWITESENPVTAVEGLIDAIDTAVASIDPVDIAQHRSRALLVGRPVALVRARMQFRLQGRAATDQSWEVLRRRVLGNDGIPADHGFSSVRFPIRLGGHDQLNDGVVGFWVETASGRLAQHFVAPHGGHVDSGGVDGRDEVHVETRVDLDAGLIWRSFDDDPLTVSMLLDPRAAVHATTGILPVKVLTIPPAQFAEALASLRVTFPTMPILTPRDAVEVALPSEPGYSWAWLQRERSGWTETPQQPTIDLADFAIAYPVDTAHVWNELIERRVVQPVDGSRSRGRLVLPLPDQPVIEPKLLRALNSVARSVQPASTRAEFGRATVLRDGWLQLRPVEASESSASAPDDQVSDENGVH